MIRTNIAIDEKLYRRAKSLARRRGVSLAELCRTSLAEKIARDAAMNEKKPLPSEIAEKPWMAFAGMFEGEPGDSASIDEVVYGRESV